MSRYSSRSVKSRFERDELRRLGEQAGAQQVSQAQIIRRARLGSLPTSGQERVQRVEEEVGLSWHCRAESLGLEDALPDRFARGQPADAQAMPAPDEKQTGGRAEIRNQAVSKSDRERVDV